MKRTTAPQSSMPLGDAVLVQNGGEGAVYARDGKALKIYHRILARRSEKLKAFQAADMQRRLPPHVFAPQRLLIDDQGQVIGFEMALLPLSAEPLKKLSQPHFCRQKAIVLGFELDLLAALSQDLHALHRADVVVGDLNDHNIFFCPAARCDVDGDARATGMTQRFWIDVDSFQFHGYPCAVAMDFFLDPQLYGVTDFAAKAVFSRDSDWYAFAVLACKILLKTHPFGGAHHQLKTIQARAKAGISVFHPDVIYPKAARPSQLLGDGLLTYFRQVFEEGRREPPPEMLFPQQSHNLTVCPDCTQSYAASRPRCPICHRSLSTVAQLRQTSTWQATLLLRTTGVLTHLFTPPTGYIVAIVRHDNSYRLLKLDDGGRGGESLLFTGKPGARFALFENILATNPPGRDELLLIDIAARQPALLHTVNSERFENEAVFATTPQALYRIAGGCLLRGELRRGRYLEEILTTAHRGHTQIWASPHGDQVAGFHRTLGSNEFFTIDRQGRQCLYTPATGAPHRQRRIIASDVAWDRKHVAFLWHEKAAGRIEHHLQVVTIGGDVSYTAVTPVTGPPFDRLDGRLIHHGAMLYPTDGSILKASLSGQSLIHELAPGCSATASLHTHPRGFLIQDRHTVHLVTPNE